jgi:DNA-binding GntR family transcriptional regulator
MPKYIMIKEYIIENIKSKNLNPGDKILSENKLAAKFKVSRVTANMAIRELATQGIVERIRGKGTYVKSIEYSEMEMYHDTSKYRKISSESLESRNHILEDVSIIIPSENVRNKLGLELTEEVYQIKRIMTMNKSADFPIALDYSYVPLKYIIDNNNINFEPLNHSYFHDFLAGKINTTLKFIHIHIDAKLASKYESEKLNVPKKYPLVIWDTNIMNKNNKVVSYTTTIADPKKYRAFINFEINKDLIIE